MAELDPSDFPAGKEGKRRMWHDLKKNPKDLPEEHNSIFAKLKGTAKWNPHMFEKISDHVDVTVELLDGTRVVDTAKTKDGTDIKITIKKDIKLSIQVFLFNAATVPEIIPKGIESKSEKDCAEESKTEEPGGNWLMDRLTTVI